MIPTVIFGSRATIAIATPARRVTRTIETFIFVVLEIEKRKCRKQIIGLRNGGTWVGFLAFGHNPYGHNYLFKSGV